MVRALLVASIVMFVAFTPQHAAADVAIKGGLSFSSTTDSQYLPDLNNRTGAAAGLSIGLPLGKSLELRPEALFVQKGGKFASGDSSLTMNELNIPALLQINIPAGGFSPYIYAGPQGEIDLKTELKDASIKDIADTKSFRWGAVAGAGILLGGSLSIEGRYNWTLTEISDNVKSKPRTLLVLAGIHFGGPK
jgi:opacity protein-like surface antigen